MFIRVTQLPTIIIARVRSLTYHTSVFVHNEFRCLNKDRSGKILLNLCTAMILLNVGFLVGSLYERVNRVDLCLATAVSTHYFVLATLAWMGVEALNMYQMLVHVFASSETCFMLKRSAVAWGEHRSSTIIFIYGSRLVSGKCLQRAILVSLILLRFEVATKK